MHYNSLKQVFEDKDRTFSGLKQVILSLSAPEATHRRAEREWTIAEIVEHLVLVESRLLKLVNVSSHKLENSGHAVSSGNLSIEIPDGVERNDYMKVKTKPEYEPTGSIPIAESMSRLQSIHDELSNLRPRLERVDLNAVSFDHWLLGSLTLGQWIAFLGIHEQRHLSQIQSIVATLKSHNHEAL